jgi:hypothetical protein
MTPKGYLLPEFYSGATGLTGRFNEGFLLRRLQRKPKPADNPGSERSSRRYS